MKIVLINVFVPKEISLKETIRLIIFYGSNIKGWLGPATQRKDNLVWKIEGKAASS
jgi:hypothetical protein